MKKSILFLLMFTGATAWALPGEDSESPVVHEFFLQTGVWTAGTIQKIFIRATDDVSGVGTIDCSHLYSHQGGRNFFLKPLGSRHEAGDIYSCSYEVGKFAVPGVYSFSGISIRDQNGSENSMFPKYWDNTYYSQSSGGFIRILGPRIPHLEIEVVNSGSADSMPPVIEFVRADKREWPLGTVQSLLFQLKDDVSGIDVTGSRYAELIPVARVPGESYDPIVIDDKTPFLRLGNGWFVAHVTVPANVPVGEYYLYYFSVRDINGNDQRIQVKDENPNEQFYEGGGGKPVPVLKINVTN